MRNYGIGATQYVPTIWGLRITEIESNHAGRVKAQTRLVYFTAIVLTDFHIISGKDPPFTLVPASFAKLQACPVGKNLSEEVFIYYYYYCCCSVCTDQPLV